MKTLVAILESPYVVLTSFVLFISGTTYAIISFRRSEALLGKVDRALQEKIEEVRKLRKQLKDKQAGK